MSLSDQEINAAVDNIFKNIDKNKDGVLDAKELIPLLNGGLRSMNKKQDATLADANAFLASFDENNDGVLSKKELFKVIKSIINRSSPK